MRWFEEHGIGNRARGAIVPVVTGAVIYDLAIGRADVRPTPDDGYRAAQNSSMGPVAVGAVGVGTGATVGKWYRGRPGRGGFATATVELPHGMIVSSFVVTNALGDIGDDGQSNLPDPTDDLLRLSTTMDGDRLTNTDFDPGTPGTSHAVIATNVALDNVALFRVARSGGQGLVRGMSPACLMCDGDVVFALSSHSGERLVVTGLDEATLIDVIGIGAAEAVRRAVLATVNTGP